MSMCSDCAESRSLPVFISNQHVRWFAMFIANTWELVMNWLARRMLAELFSNWKGSQSSF